MLIRNLMKETWAKIKKTEYSVSWTVSGIIQNFFPCLNDSKYVFEIDVLRLKFST